MTRHDRAIQPAAEATGETVRSGGSRDERRVRPAAVGRFRVTKRRSRGGPRRLARPRSGADREAPRARGAFFPPPAENASCAAGPTKTQENGRTGARSISRDSLRSEARRAPILASAFSSATRVSRTLGEAVRGASLGDLSARRGRRISRDANHGCHGTSLDLAIDRRASLRAPTPRGRAARPPGKHAPGDPLAVMVSGADAIRARRPPL